MSGGLDKHTLYEVGAHLVHPEAEQSFPFSDYDEHISEPDDRITKQLDDGFRSQFPNGHLEQFGTYKTNSLGSHVLASPSPNSIVPHSNPRPLALLYESAFLPTDESSVWDGLQVKDWSDRVTQFNVAPPQSAHVGSAAHIVLSSSAHSPLSTASVDFCFGETPHDVGQWGHKTKATARAKRPKSERTHACEICEQSFLYPKDVKRHMSTHSKARDYKCHHCRRSYNRADNLRRHVRQDHPDESESLSAFGDDSRSFRKGPAQPSSSLADAGDETENWKKSGLDHFQSRTINVHSESNLVPGTGAAGERSPSEIPSQGSRTRSKPVRKHRPGYERLRLACRSWRNSNIDHPMCERGFDAEHRLFEHDRRRHRQYYCIKCLIKFDNENDWIDHTKSRFHCSGCSLCFGTKLEKQRHDCDPSRKVSGLIEDVWQSMYDKDFGDGIFHNPYIGEDFPVNLATRRDFHGSINNQSAPQLPPSIIADRSPTQSAAFPSVTGILRDEGRNDTNQGPPAVGMIPFMTLEETQATREQPEQSDSSNIHRVLEPQWLLLNPVSGTAEQDDIRFLKDKVEAQRQTILIRDAKINRLEQELEMLKTAMRDDSILPGLCNLTTSLPNKRPAMVGTLEKQDISEYTSTASATFSNSQSAAPPPSSLTDGSAYQPYHIPRMNHQAPFGQEAHERLKRPASDEMEYSAYRGAPSKRAIRQDAPESSQGSYRTPEQNPHHFLHSIYGTEHDSQERSSYMSVEASKLTNFAVPPPEPGVNPDLTASEKLGESRSPTPEAWKASYISSNIQQDKKPLGQDQSEWPAWCRW